MPAAEARDYAVQRWVTLAACLVATLCSGFSYAWSVLLRPLMDTYGWTVSDVSLSFTALSSTAAVMAIVAGKALQYLQPRTLLLLGGVVFGAGIACLGFAHSLATLYGFAFFAGIGGIVYPGATMANLMRFFPDRRGLASGLVTAGFGLGAVLWAPVAVALIGRLGLPWTLRVLGGTFVVIIGLCSLLVKTAPQGYAPAGWTPPAPRASDVRKGPDKDWKGMLAAPGFWVLALLFVIGTTSGMMVIGHASPIARDILGLSPTAAGAVVSYVAMGMVAGKLGWGVLSDKIGRTPVLVAMLVVAALALVTVWRTDSYVPVVLGMSAVGLCYGGFLALMGPVTADAFGATHLGVNFGIMFLTVAIAAFVGPRLAAAMSAAHGGHYSLAFVVAAVITAVGIVVVAVYTLLARRRAAAVES